MQRVGRRAMGRRAGAEDAESLAGWKELLDADGATLAWDENPVARSIRRVAITSMDVLIRARDDVQLRASVFSRLILDTARSAPCRYRAQQPQSGRRAGGVLVDPVA